MDSLTKSFLDIGPRLWSAPELPERDLVALAAGSEANPEPTPDPVEQAISGARAEAAGLVQGAQAEAEQIRSQAREEGLAETTETLAQEREQLAAQQTAAIAEINAERERFYREAEPELLKLAFTIAEKIIGRELSEHPELVLDLIRKSLKRLKDKSELRIRVNPEDLQLVREARAELAGSVDGIEKIEVTDDRRVGRGGCIIESPDGTLDARIATQLAEVERSMEKVSK